MSYILHTDIKEETFLIFFNINVLVNIKSTFFYYLHI